MANLNKVFLIGNLTRKPELKYTTGRTGVVNVGVAVNRRFKNSAGELKEEVTFVEVSIFGRQAETCTEYLDKGSPVFIEGRLHLDQWEHQGEKKTKLKVIAERLQFLPRRNAKAMDKGDAGDVAETEPASATAGGGDDGLPPDDGVPF